MRVFVTGGTGLLGNTIIRQLGDAGHEVSALVRSTPDPRVFADTNVQLVHGQITDENVIQDAVERCETVIHSAGLIHLGWKRMDESIQVNRDGTQTIANACLRHGKKLVHIGTVNAMALGTRDKASDETVPLDYLGGQVPCAYVVSKLAGVKIVKQAVQEGLKASIIHPGFMLGPWDWKPSSGRMIVELGRGWKPIAPSGGCSVCDSRDVAATTIDAITMGREDGREYIVAGDNWTYKRLWSEMARRMGKTPPRISAGPLQRWIAAKFGDLMTGITGREGDVNSASVGMSSLFHFHDSSRAVQELNYRRRPIEQTLDEATAWLKQHHGS